MKVKLIKFSFLAIISISLFNYFNSYDDRFDKKYISIIKTLNTGYLKRNEVNSYVKMYPNLGEINVIDLLADISIKNNDLIIKQKIDRIYPYVKYSKNFQHLVLNYFFINGTDDDIKKIYTDVYRACTVHNRLNNIYTVSESDIKYIDTDKYIYIDHKDLYVNKKLFRELTYVSSGLYKIEIPKSTIELLISDSDNELKTILDSKEKNTMICFINTLNAFSVSLTASVIN